MPIFVEALTPTQKKLQKLVRRQFESRPVGIEPLPPTPTSESQAALVNQFAGPPSARAPTPPTQLPTAIPTPGPSFAASRTGRTLTPDEMKFLPKPQRFVSPEQQAAGERALLAEQESVPSRKGLRFEKPVFATASQIAEASLYMPEAIIQGLLRGRTAEELSQEPGWAQALNAVTLAFPPGVILTNPILNAVLGAGEIGPAFRAGQFAVKEAGKGVAKAAEKAAPYAKKLATSEAGFARIPKKPIAKEPWQMTREEFAAGKSALERRNQSLMPIRDPRSHYAQIVKAINEGKPVPPEVRAEWLDLPSTPAPVARPPAAAVPEAVAPRVVATAADIRALSSSDAIARNRITDAASKGPISEKARVRLAAINKKILANREKAKPAPAEAVAPGAAGQVPAGEVKPPMAKAPPPAEPFAANIRLSKYPEDIRSTIKEWADANPGVVQEARRGVRSDAQVLADAKKLVEDLGGNFQRLQRRWKPGEAWNAEELTAIRGTLSQKTQKVLEAARAAREVDSSANHATFLLALEEEARIQQIVHGVSAEPGRALRALRQETFDAVKANDVERLEELLKRVGGKAKASQMAEALIGLNLADPVAVNKFIRDMTKPQFWDYITELYYNSILSGPKTHIINDLSNTVTTSLAAPERGLAVPFEQAIARLQGRQVERFFAEVPADILGAVQGIEEGLRGALYTMRHGISPTQATKWEFRPRAFEGVLGKIVNLPSNLLESADVLNRSINYRAALNALIVRQAKKEGLKGKALLERIAELKATPTEALMKESNRIAEYRLFRQPLGSIGARVTSIRDTDIVWKGFQPLRFVIPFIRTPLNLVKFGLERSPAGFFNPTLWKNLAAKSPEASDQIARAFLGSMVAAAFGVWFGQGRLTGKAPTTAAERDRFYREGKQPFAVKIGNTWIQWQRVEPLNQTLSLLVASLDAIQNKDKDFEDKAAQAASSIGQNLISQTYVSGLASLLDAMSQPERYAERYLTRLATGFIPASSVLRTAAQIVDPTVRRPEGIAQAAQAGIPGLSQNVLPALTAFGEPVQRQTIPWLPINISKAREDEVDAELARLGVDLGFVGGTLGGETLTPTEKFRYQVLAGQKTKVTLSLVIRLPAYRGLTDAGKEQAIQRIINAAREEARAIVLAERSGQPAGSPVSPQVPLPGQPGPAIPGLDLEKYRRSRQSGKPSSKIRRTVDITGRDENGRVKSAVLEEVLA